MFSRQQHSRPMYNLPHERDRGRSPATGRSRDGTRDDHRGAQRRSSDGSRRIDNERRDRERSYSRERGYRRSRDFQEFTPPDDKDRRRHSRDGGSTPERRERRTDSPHSPPRSYPLNLDGSYSSSTSSLLHSSSLDESKNLQLYQVFKFVISNFNKGYCFCKRYEGDIKDVAVPRNEVDQSRFREGDSIHVKIIDMSDKCKVRGTLNGIDPKTGETSKYPWMQANEAKLAEYNSLLQLRERAIKQTRPSALLRDTVKLPSFPDVPTFCSNVPIDVEQGDLETIAQTLAGECAALLEQLQNASASDLKNGSLRDNYRLELAPLRSYPLIADSERDARLWHLRLSVDSCVWFDYLTRTKLDNALQIASKYAEEYKEAENPAGVNEDEEPTVQVAAAPEHFEADIKCFQIVQRKDGTRPCKWGVANELIISDWPINDRTDKRYILVVRHEAMRDILMLPCPPWHATNTIFVKDSQFWYDALLFARTLALHQQEFPTGNDQEFPVKLLALNFGRWETAVYKDVYARDCHAHCHFLLSTFFVSNCSTGCFKPLNGRTADPPFYLADDAQKLEVSRLLGARVDALQEKMTTRMDTLQGEVQKIARLQQDMSTQMNTIQRMFESFLSKASPESIITRRA
jgi:hypothetical protein